jgi:aminopeptidase N
LNLPIEVPGKAIHAEGRCQDQRATHAARAHSWHNLKDAKSAYGAIVYEKAPAVIKQLEFRIGSEKFRDGLRLYLKQHAYRHAEWDDIISPFKLAGGGPARGASGDLHAWAQAWIRHRGMPQVHASWSCTNGKLSRLVFPVRFNKPVT